MNIITKTSSVRSLMREAFKVLKTLNAKYRVLAISTAWHMAKHGDPSLLNEFYEGLSAAHQAAFKRWIVREVSQTYTGTPQISDLWIGFSKGKFTVKQGEVFNREAFVDYIEAQSDDPGYGRFFDVDPDKVANPFNNTKLLEQLHNLLKKATKEQENGNVDATLVEAMGEAVALVDRKAASLLVKPHLTVM